ncbi:hypothetical protein BOTBODRAFT_27731 [Botryobasidium botryosum FD-172 SS1]|uniref:Acyl carrier protein n=1 Tax=Botryobasidium botryosum (strain FD-172 SS1) TaxID=930990 RepID=A0A067MXK2_BOTB1|nr:hypothetical protein BOTBODRAFT_27731 [Botryobasidium botryosum FD-172 SS1]
MNALRTSFRLVASNARATSLARPVASLQIPRRPLLPFRGYSAAAGLSKEDIQARIFDVLKSFEKVKTEKITPTASFADDLGLDSLDAVEVVMNIEEEFSIEIPDAEADEIKTVQQAIDYISKTPEAH